MTAPFPLPDRDDPALAPFWAGAAAGVLKLPRRLADGGFDWYPTGAAVEWVTLPGSGRLFSWAVVQRPLFAGYTGIAPYVSALVLPDGAPGVRLVTRLLAAPGTLALDMPLRACFVDLAYPGEPAGVVGPLFEPA